MRWLPFTLLVLAAACSDDGGSSDGPALVGQKEGSERWIVLFDDEPLDLTAYKAAVTAGAGVLEAEDALREQAEKRRRDFAKNLKDLEGSVVEHWPLTNAVTVELPRGNVGTLGKMAGVKELRPDRLIE